MMWLCSCVYNIIYSGSMDTKIVLLLDSVLFLWSVLDVLHSCLYNTQNELSVLTAVAIYNAHVKIVQLLLQSGKVDDNQQNNNIP